MNTLLETKAKVPTQPSFTPVHNGLLQRKCACGGSPGASGSCAECSRQSLTLQRQTLDRGDVSSTSTFSNSRPISNERETTNTVQISLGHSFGKVRVKSEQEQPQSNQMRATSSMTDMRDSAELPLSGEVEPDVDLAQEPAPTEAPADAAEEPKSCCSMESFDASNDSYVDTDTDTRKNIKFTYKMKSGSDEKKCVMVNWIQGTAKNKDGTFRQVKMFEKTMDYNFPTMRIDSLDKDPVYWSDGSARWHYQPAGANSFYATDSPGPTVWADGIDYDLKFKMCLHCIDDVSATSDETGSGVKNPLKCIDWVFKAKYDAAAKKFTH